jgi:hypothetical protein
MHKTAWKLGREGGKKGAEFASACAVVERRPPLPSHPGGGKPIQDIEPRSGVNDLWKTFPLRCFLFPYILFFFTSALLSRPFLYTVNISLFVVYSYLNNCKIRESTNLLSPED